MRKCFFLPALLAFLLQCGCGATIKAHFPAGSVSLRQYPKLHLMLVTATGAVSTNKAAMLFSGGVIGAGHVVSGSSQALLVAQNLSFELAALGFQMVDTQDNADAILLFSIGTLRLDPLAGWIADQAFLEFKDRESEITICTFRAKGQFITPTANKIVGNLVAQIRKHY